MSLLDKKTNEGKESVPKEPEVVPVSSATNEGQSGVSVSQEQFDAVINYLNQKGLIKQAEPEEQLEAPTRRNSRVKSDYELKEFVVKGTQRYGSTYSELRPLETTLSFFTNPIEEEINNNFSRVWITAAYMASRKGLKRSAAVDTAIEAHIAWLTGKQSKDGKVIDAIFAQQIKQKFQTNVDSIFNKAAMVGGSTNQNAPVNPASQ